MSYRLFSIPSVSFSKMLSVRFTIRWLTSRLTDSRIIFAKTVNISLFGMETIWPLFLGSALRYPVITIRGYRDLVLTFTSLYVTVVGRSLTKLPFSAKVLSSAC